VARKKFFRRPKPPREQAPQPFAADFRTRAVETQDGPFRMLAGGPPDGRANVHPIAHGGNLAEGHSRLRHAELAWIHA
jgi:hypothetical protein